LISFLAAFISLLYGAYSTWNWSIADRIAEKYNWTEQQSDYIPVSNVTFPLILAKPCKDKIAWVFKIFFLVCVLSFGVHVVLLFYAILTWIMGY
ncbi:MAG: hypothetical protein ABI840_02740, partial [bacterium]